MGYQELGNNTKKSDFADFSELEKKAKEVKFKMLQLHKEANSGHIGASLSCMDLMIYLLLYKMDKEDLFLLSKGHAATGLYSVLHEKGLISDEQLRTFYKDGTYLAAHPPATGINGILFSTGSLGHGPSLCCGIALGLRFKNKVSKVYCIISDGECNEGSVWEAAMFAAHNKLKNLIFIMDKNNIQAFGRTEEVINMNNMADRWKSFGWDVAECNGHDFSEIDKTINNLENNNSDRPKILIANTIKGKGVSFMENRVEWHYLPMNDEQYAQACNEILGQAG